MTLTLARCTGLDVPVLDARPQQMPSAELSAGRIQRDVKKELYDQLESLRIETREKSQALRPLSITLGIVSSTAVPMMLWGVTWVKCLGAVLLVIAFLSVLWWYRHFALRDPDRLGSERFVINQKILKLAEQAKDPALLTNVVETEEVQAVTIEAKTRSLPKSDESNGEG